jgi:FtsX-like permease family
MVVTWLRLESRRRWRSLVVVALLVALTAGTVLAAVAGARRGQSAWDRLWARTLPATVTVLPNQPGFDWSKIEALPEVSATALFIVLDGELLTGTGPAGSFSSTNTGMPPGDAGMLHTVELPVVLAGHNFDAGRADEVVASQEFMTEHHLQVGAPLTVHLPSAAQAEASFDPTSGQAPRGPLVQVRIVGVVRTPFWLDAPDSGGGVLLNYAFTEKYRQYILGGDPAHSSVYVNALMRLKGGEAAIPAFKADLARVTHRSDIDVWDNYGKFGGPVKKATNYEALVLLAFGVAALLAALFLIGQTVARYAAETAEDLRVLQAMGLTRRKAVACAGVVLGLAAVAGATVGVAAALIASRWMPIGIASYAEPRPGFDADWLVLIPGWAAVVLLVAGGTALLTWFALSTRRTRDAPRGSVLARAASAAGLPVAAVMGARFALEPGRGRAAVPVFPAVMGAVAGVLGVLAAFTFSAGVSDAVAHPERFGITWQLDSFYGLDGQDIGPSAQVSQAVAASPDVAGVLDSRIGGAQSSGVSVESFEYKSVGGKAVPVVLTAGTMPASEAGIAIAPTTAQQLHAAVGSVITLTGGPVPRTMTVTGIGFVPDGPHNSYDQGAWLTPAGFDWLFGGTHYKFKFHVAAVTLRPGIGLAAGARAVNAAVATVKGGQNISFTPTQPDTTVVILQDLSVLPTALGGFLALLAFGAVGYALTTAVRRRGRELAVLRALGLTARQARLVIVTQATVLAVVGIAAGIPLGLVVSHAAWRAVTNFIPLAYQPPLAPWALILIAPATLLGANLLAVWPGWRAARLRAAQVLRTE